jgi:acyl-CoA-binding protein
LTARISMADAKFSFQEKGRVYYPAWMSPEGKVEDCRSRQYVSVVGNVENKARTSFFSCLPVAVISRR